MSDLGETAELLPDDIRFIRGVQKAVRSKMYGIDGVIDSLLVALITGGHVLLEGNPGLGKTSLITSLHHALSLPADKKGRIQFTPDLMPSDITGTLMPTEGDSRRLEFKRGPIFTWLLLADEINRATPKTQAAMLEAMAEKQVTVLGKSEKLTLPREAWLGQVRYVIRPPFMVMATQNPIDQEGTYNLPEAQSDRFMFKVRMPFPDNNILRQIVEKEMKPEDTSRIVDESKPSEKPSELCDETLVRIANLGRAVRGAEGDRLLSRHIRNIVLASNGTFDKEMGLPEQRKISVRKFVDDYIRYPLGPRAAFAMELGARGLAVLFVDPDRPETLIDHTPTAFSRLCLPAIRHRLKLRMGWERSYRAEGSDVEGLGTDRLQDKLLCKFIMLCAPDDAEYCDTLEQSLKDFLKAPV